MSAREKGLISLTRDSGEGKASEVVGIQAKRVVVERFPQAPGRLGRGNISHIGVPWRQSEQKPDGHANSCSTTEATLNALREAQSVRNQLPALLDLSQG